MTATGDLAFPHPMTHAEADTWAEYLTGTAEARERYSSALDAANAHYQQVKQSAHVLADAISRQAWEQYQDAASAAWAVYQLDTQEARRSRETALGQPYPGLTP